MKCAILFTFKEQRVMVLIFSGHHFSAQNVFRIEKPLAACVATEEEKLLVATEGHRIEAHALNGEKVSSLDQEAVHSFPTVDLVKMIVYSSIGHYVAAVEVKTSRHSLLSAVRVYMNWQTNDAKEKPMRARIAGRVTPSSHSALGQLDMIEIPLTRQACHVAICNRTGNLAASCVGAVVSVFTFCVKVHDISRLRFNDFEPLFDVQLAFPVKEVAFCEDVLACMSHNELQVLWLGSSASILRSKKREMGRKADKDHAVKPRHDFVDDPYFIRWDLSRSGSESMENNLHSDSWPLSVYLPSLMQQMESSGDEVSREGRQVLGPVEYVVGRPVSVEFLGTGSGDTKAVTLLYRRFPADVVDELDNVQCVHSVQLNPFYLERNCAAVLTGNNVLHSKQRWKLAGMACIFSTGHECFLYEIEFRAEQTKVSQLRSLQFSTAARQVIVDGAVLHAVSLSVLETYTLGMSQFSSLDMPEMKVSCGADATCLVGLCPFLNLRHAVFGGGHLVLFSSSAGSDESWNSSEPESVASWTAYDLRCPSGLDFHRDMVEEAESFRESNPNVYAQILREAACAGFSSHDVSMAKQLEETFKNLGEFYLRSEKYEDNILALEFLKRANLLLERIVLTILKHCINNDTKRRLLPLLMSVLEERVSIGDPGLTMDTANSVLDFVCSMDQFRLAQLILGSRFAGYDCEKALKFLKKNINLKPSSAEDSLAACVLCVKSGDNDRVPCLMVSVPMDTIISVTRRYPQVWFTNRTTCSVILQTLQQLKPEAFIEVLMELIECKHLEPRFLVDLCQSDWEDLGLAPNKHLLLERCLETYITRAIKKRCLDGINCCPEIAMHLVDIYLSKLAAAEISRLPTALNVAKPWCLFGPRKCWLNELEPFAGRDFQGKCYYDDPDGDESLECPCSRCCSCLLRLQSLLCSVVATPEIQLRVNRASKLDAEGPYPGALSLHVLTSNPAEAIDILVSCGEHSALKEFGKDVSDGPKMWKHALTALHARWTREASDEGGEGILTAMHGVLSHLSEVLSVTELVELFPDGSDLGPFVCHVRRCLSKQQADRLKLDIMAKERDLQSFA